MERKMPKAYGIIWGAITLAYAIWMCFFMPQYVLVNYETLPTEMNIDGKFYGNLSGMVGMHWLYPVWVILSCVTLLLFIVYIKKFLYCEEQTKAMKIIAMIAAIYGCVYVIWYGFFGEEPFIDKVRYITASMIGMNYPWHFRGWGVFSAATVFINTMYCYRKFNYSNRLGMIMGIIGSAAIYVTVNCPSMGENSLTTYAGRARMIGHWAGALIFAVGCAAPVVIFLFSKAIKLKGRFLATFIIFCLVLLLMLALLIFVGKSAIIENIPMVVAYILLFALNFTKIYDKGIEAK